MLINRFLRLLTLLLICQISFGQGTNRVGSGNALSLDGANDKVDLGANFNGLVLPVTIMAWVNIGTSTIIQPIFSSSSHPTNWHGLWMHCASDRIQAGFANGIGGFGPGGRRVKSASTSFTLANDWFHVAAVIIDGNNVRLYVNGVEQSGTFSGSATSMLNNPSGNADIGYHKRASDTYFTGDIDEVRIWDIALTEQQIREQMCRQVDPNMTGLFAAYDFNEGSSAASLADATGLFNGTRTGGASTIASGAAVGNTSTFNYNVSPGNGAVDFTFGVDSIIATANGSMDGLQIYRIDTLPKFSNGITIPPGLNHYYGVFSAHPSDRFDLTYSVVPPFYAPPSTYDFANRSNNSVQSWAINGSGMNPSISLTNQGPHQEVIVHLDSLVQCTAPGQLPETFETCADSIVIIVPNSLDSLLWNDNDTARRKVFYRGQSNPIYFLDAQDQSGCLTRDTISLTFNTANYTPIPDDEFCDSISISLSGLLQNVVWDNGSNSLQRRFTNPGTYSYTALDPQSGCTFSDTFNLRRVGSSGQLGALPVSAEPYCLGDTIILEAPAGFSVRWPSGSDSTVAVWSDNTLRAEFSTPCFDTTVFVTLRFTDCRCAIHIPTAFSPNGDGRNESLKPIGVCDFESYYWQISNRWGQEVFYTTDPEEAFDGNLNGQAMPEGVYVYRLFIKTPHVERTIRGIFTIIR